MKRLLVILLFLTGCCEGEKETRTVDQLFIDKQRCEKIGEFLGVKQITFYKYSDNNESTYICNLFKKDKLHVAIDVQEFKTMERLIRLKEQSK